jgi:hypothetical protein
LKRDKQPKFCDMREFHWIGGTFIGKRGQLPKKERKEVKHREWGTSKG